MKVHRYVLRLDVDHAKLAFQGRVEVHLQHDGGPLALHAVDLEVSTVKVGGREVPWTLDAPHQSIQVPQVPKGEAVVEVEYRGKAAEEALMGLYRSAYGDSYILVSQLEPLGARHILPCIDEPAQKAEFHVTISTASGLQALFNTPVASEKQEGDRVVRTFAPTPRMSTYLLFFGIGKFEERRKNHGSTEVIVACPPGRGSSADFALDNAVKVLEFFERYFEIPYPLPKLHLVAVPNTAVGGMENWGGITFRERLLLVTPDMSQAAKRQAMGVIAHEIAHQWFGDLVTMAWWNDLWLNESFATFMDYQATSAIYPEWDIWSDMATTTSNSQLWDALPHSHPIDVPVEDPDDIQSIFDEISYGKGASILGMIEAHIGREAFRKGVARYLKRYAYANARGEDLWKALDEESKEPVTPLMKSWVGRPGYPALTAHHEGGELRLEQHRFLLLPPEPGAPAEPPWPIPLTVQADGQLHRQRMDGPVLKLPVKDPNGVVVNAGRAGFLRVRYAGDLGRSVRARFSSLSTADRWGVLQDTYAFTLAGEETPESYLEVIRACGAEKDYRVLSELGMQLSGLFPVLRDRPPFQEVGRAVIVEQLERIGLAPREHESNQTGVLRETFAGLRVAYDPAFAQELAARFDRIDEEVPALRGAIARSYARVVGDPAFDVLLGRLKSAPSDEVASRMARALGSFQDPKVIERSVVLPFGGEVSPTFGIEIMVAMIGNPAAYSVMWSNLKETLPVVMEVLGGSGIVPLLLQWSIPYLGLDRQEELREYFAKIDVGEGKGGMIKGFDLLAVHSRLRERFLRPAVAPAAGGA